MDLSRIYLAVHIRLTIMDTRNNKTKRCLYQLTLNAKLGDFSLESKWFCQ